MSILINLTADVSLAPLRKTDGAAGYDLYSCINVVIQPNSREMIDVGFSMQFPNTMYAKIENRSSISIKGINVCAGVIDSDYRGNINVILHNTKSIPFIINIGDRIAQMIFIKIETPELIFSNKLNNTIRGNKGFGSTGQ